MNSSPYYVGVMPVSDCRIVKIYEESLPELTRELESLGLCEGQQTKDIIYQHFIKPAIYQHLFIGLFKEADVLGYEFVSLSPFDQKTVIAAFTYITKGCRGRGLSHLLRAEMLSQLLKKGIKKIYFSVNNSNEESKGNLVGFQKKYKITEVSRTYCVEL